MIITKLILKNYRKFESKEINFTQGINVVIGDNEAGKSTIFQAILDGLYMDPTTKNKDYLDKVIKWHSQKLPYIEIEFVHDIYKYKLIKDFQDKIAILKNIDNGDEEKSMSEIQKRMLVMTGFPSKDVYTNTAYISQSDIAKIEKKRDFVNALQNVVNESSRDVNIQNVIYSIEKQIKNLRNGLDRQVKEPGPISLSKERIKYLESHIEEVKMKVNNLKTTKDEGTKAYVELTEVDKRIKNLDDLITSNDKLAAATKRMKELDAFILQIEADLNAYNELLMKKNFVEKNLKQYQKFMELDYDKAANDLNNAIEMRKIANAELGRYSIIDDEGVKEDDNLAFKVFIYLLGVIFSGVIFVLTVNLTIFFISILIASTFISMYFYWRDRYAYKQVLKQKNLINQQRDQWKYRIQDSSDQIKTILDNFQCENPSIFFTNKARFIIERQELKELDDQIKGLLNGRNIEDLRSRQNDLMLEKKSISNETLNELVLKERLSSSEYYAKIRELEDLKRKRHELEKVSTISQIRVEDGAFDNESLVELEEELENEKKLLSMFERKVDVLSLVKSTIEKSLEVTAKTMRDVVETGMGDSLANITFDRYSKFKLDENLDIQVYSKEKNDWIYPEVSLSKGTIDQIYFLIRVIYSRSISKKEPMPIICDDVFVTFDEGRLSKTREFLEADSNKQQTILFSCDDEYVDWGNVIYLE